MMSWQALLFSTALKDKMEFFEIVRPFLNIARACIRMLTSAQSWPEKLLCKMSPSAADSYKYCTTEQHLRGSYVNTAQMSRICVELA